MTLIDLDGIVSHARFDIRYATQNNFIGERVYPVARAFLAPEPAYALATAADAFKEHGIGVVVWDAYRPAAISQLFWDRTPEHLRSFLGNPANGGSPHNRGCAIDMTLYDIATGKQLAMPSEFDDFSKRATMAYNSPTQEIRRNRAYLCSVMEEHGFHVRSDEWWHYTWHDFRQYPVLDIPLTDI